jgi:hypothetical protein
MLLEVTPHFERQSLKLQSGFLTQSLIKEIVHSINQLHETRICNCCKTTGIDRLKDKLLVFICTSFHVFKPSKVAEDFNIRTPILSMVTGDSKLVQEFLKLIPQSH